MINDILSESPLFRGITKDEISEYFNKIRYSKRVYKPESIIVFQDSVCDDMYIQTSGIALSEMVSSSGKHIIVEELVAPRIFAPAFIYAKNPCFPVSVIAKKECNMIIIHRDQLSILLRQDERIMNNYLEIISQQVVFLTNQVKFFGLKNLKEKIASYFLSHYDEKHIKFELIHTQQELSERFGVARPSLARAIAEMELDGVIQVDKREVEIKNIKLLKDMAR